MYSVVTRRAGLEHLALQHGVAKQVSRHAFVALAACSRSAREHAPQRVVPLSLLRAKFGRPAGR